MGGGIPGDVEQLITAHIDSVEKLEILLLLHGEPERVWTASGVSREIRRNPSSVARCLKQLAAGKLIEGSEAGGYLFRHSDAAVVTSVDRLAETYAARRVSVVALIAANPLDAVTSFSDAFRFRKKR